MTTSSLPLGLYALCCLAAAALGNLIVVSAGDIAFPAFSPLSGVLVGALILTEQSRWRTLVPTAAAAMLVADVLFGRPVLQSAAFSFVLGVEGAAAAWLLRRAFERLSLTRLTHVWTLLGVAALVPMAGGVAAATLLGLGAGAWLSAWRAWWLMDALGIVLITPLVVAAVTERTAFVGAMRLRNVIEMAAVLAAGTMMSAIVFGSELNPLFRVPAYLLPFFLWSVFRFGVGGTAATIFVLSFVGLWNTAQGRGPFVLPDATVQDWVLRSQGTMGIAAASLLLMAGAVAERKRVARENEILVADLQQALTEIRTLRGFIPMCAWCHKVRDDAGFWQQIESYLDARTDATFSHSICPACTEHAHDELTEHALFQPDEQ